MIGTLPPNSVNRLLTTGRSAKPGELNATALLITVGNKPARAIARWPPNEEPVAETVAPGMIASSCANSPSEAVSLMISDSK